MRSTSSVRALTLSLPLLMGAAWLALPGCDSAKSDESKDDDGKKSKKKKKKKKKKKCKDFKSCDKACSKDDAKACVKLGDIHRTEPHGEDGKWDKKAAISAYTKACKADDQLGCAKQAAMEAYTVKKSYERAEKACKKDVDLGCAIYGGILARGRSFDDGKIEKDPAAGMKVLEKHCNAGKMMSCSSLGFVHYWGDKRNETEAKTLWGKACDKDELQGCFALGAWGDKDEEETLKLLGKACDGGLSGGFIGGDNACRVEAEKQIKWLTKTLVRAYVDAGEPAPGSSAAAAFRKKLDENKVYVARKKRVKAISKKACSMGSEDACKLMTDDDNKTWFKED